MNDSTRPASFDDIARLWPAVKAARLMASADELASFRSAGPWRVRVTDTGDALLLASWRAHLHILAIRGLWAPQHRIAELVADATAVARAQGFAQVLSPLLAASELQAYVAAGMEVAEPIIALQGLAEDVAVCRRPADVTLRIGSIGDLADIVQLDAACFNEFWRYGPQELGESLSHERVLIAEKDGALLGYATCSLHGGSATVGRLAVSPRARRQGVGMALLSDVAGFALRSGAYAVTLCTQEANEASRALYASASMIELSERYALAACRA